MVTLLVEVRQVAINGIQNVDSNCIEKHGLRVFLKLTIRILYLQIYKKPSDVNQMSTCYVCFVLSKL
jgi:hypothetical protein